MLILTLLVAGCAPGGEEEPQVPARGQSPASTEQFPAVPESNRIMGERIAAIFDTSDPTRNYMLNPQRARLVLQAVEEATDIKQKLYFRVQYASELIRAGEVQKAIEEFGAIETSTRQNRLDLGPRNRAYVRRYEALAWLRLGEQVNCQINHTTESCLLPIQGEGVHRDQTGSRGAIAVLLDNLAERPESLESRWLLNIAYMTVGEYPEGVPEQWLIEPSVFESDAEVSRFSDVAGVAGLDVDGLAGGSIVEDFDNDGFLDVMVSSSRSTGPLRFFLNNGDGTFTEKTREAGLEGEVAALNLTTADYNNDAYVDVLMLRGGWLGSSGRIPNSLLRNNRDGTFTDVTEEAGLLAFHPTQTATWFDYDGDGWIDVFIGNETGGDFFAPESESATEVHPAELYRNNGDGTFTDCADQAGVAVTGYVKAVVSGDYDNDGRPDLYISRRMEPNTLLRNAGPDPVTPAAECGWRFVDETTTAGVSGPKFSFPVWFFDYDNDGWLDLFVTGYLIQNVAEVAADYLGQPNQGEKSKLYRNTGQGTFEDVTAKAGLDHVLLAMGVNYGDIDNDGWLDFYLGTGEPQLATLIPNRLFRNDGQGAFQDVTTSAGVGHLQKGHGVSFADIDNDGDQDIYHTLGGFYWGDNYRNALFENPGNDNHWVKLILEGVRSNRSAIGARLKLVIDTESGKREIHRTVGTGGSFGVSPLRQEIGLGQATGIIRLEIRWPSGEEQLFEGLGIDSAWRIKEGDDTPAPEPLRSISIPHEHRRHQH